MGAQIASAPPRDPRRFVRNLPPDLTAICMKALQYDPAWRYLTAQELSNDLRRWLRREPTVARPGVHRAVWLWTRRNTGWAMALVTLVLVLVLVPASVALYIQREKYVQELLGVPSTGRAAGWPTSACGWNRTPAW